MKGYHKREEETNKTIVNGWLRTGDIAHFDEDGQFFITDRLKELIKVRSLITIMNDNYYHTILLENRIMRLYQLN